MDKIIFKNIALFAHHGVTKEEQRLGQTFLVDVEIGLDLKPAAKEDALAHTACYAQLFEIVKKRFQVETYQLLETVAERLAGHILQNISQARTVTLRIKKPHPPLEVTCDYFGIEIERIR